MFNAPVSSLHSAFQSIMGYYWYLRLRGWEIDDVEFGRKSYGAMYSLPQPLTTPQELSPILHKLIEKTCYRMRQSGYQAKGIHVGLLYRDHSFWHQGRTKGDSIFDSHDIYRLAFRIMCASPYQKPVANLSVSVFNLEKSNSTQLDLFNTINRKLNLSKAIDKITERWGNFVITPAMMLGTSSLVPDRVGFGNIKDLEQFVFGDD